MAADRGPKISLSVRLMTAATEESGAIIMIVTVAAEMIARRFGVGGVRLATGKVTAPVVKTARSAAALILALTTPTVTQPTAFAASATFAISIAIASAKGSDEVMKMVTAE
jgi:hypothetical protein